MLHYLSSQHHHHPYKHRVNTVYTECITLTWSKTQADHRLHGLFQNLMESLEHMYNELMYFNYSYFLV